MIQLAIALLVGFVVGWLALLRRDIQFTALSAVILLALMEALSYAWLMWRKHLLEPKPRFANSPIIWHFVVGAGFGLIMLQFGESIGEDLRLLATLPIAMVLVLNLYKIASGDEKII